MGSEPKRERILKPRHAAALALVGWYLMTPPIDRAGSGGQFWVPANEPLSMWSTDRTFSSEDECKSALANLKQSHIYTGYSGRGDSEYAKDQQRQQAICVSTDDPRLKEK
jgi:hypothetical protein